MKCIPLTCGYLLLIFLLPHLFVLLSCSPSILFCLASFSLSRLCFLLCHLWNHPYSLPVSPLYFLRVEHPQKARPVWLPLSGSVQRAKPSAESSSPWPVTVNGSAPDDARCSAAPSHDPNLLLHHLFFSIISLWALLFFPYFNNTSALYTLFPILFESVLFCLVFLSFIIYLES